MEVKKKQIEGSQDSREKANLGLGIVGIAGLSFASFHAKNPLKLHIRNHNIVSFESHSAIVLFVFDMI